MLKKLWKRIKERRTIRKINKAFGFPLREYQIEYIFGRINFLPSNRQSGRTLAHCIRLCLSEGPPLDIKEELRKSGQPLTLEPYRGAEFETHYNSPHYLRTALYNEVFEFESRNVNEMSQFFPEFRPKRTY